METGPEKIKPPLAVLAFLDGWGIAPPGESNLISRARTPYFDNLLENYPATVLSLPEKIKLSRENIYQRAGKLEQAGPGVRCLGQKLAKAGFRQLRLGMSDNIGLLCGFFDQGVLAGSAGYAARIVPSPLDHDPKAFAAGLKRLGSEAAKAGKSGEADFIAVSFPDAGRYASLPDRQEAIMGLEAIDKQLKAVVDSALRQKGAVFLLGGYGSLEQVPDDSRPPWPVTANPLPFAVISEKHLGVNLDWPSPDKSDLSAIKPGVSLADFTRIFLELLLIK